VHVVGVLTAIEHEGALVDHGTGNAAIGRDAWLQRHESAAVAADGRQCLQEISRDGGAYGGIHALEVGAAGGDLDGLCDRTELELDVHCGGKSDLDLLLSD